MRVVNSFEERPALNGKCFSIENKCLGVHSYNLKYTLLALVTFTVGSTVSATQSNADCILTTAPNIYTCEGATTSSQTLFTADNSTVNIADTYSLTESGGGIYPAALAIWGRGTLSYTDESGSVINTIDANYLDALRLILGHDLPNNNASLIFKSNGDFISSGSGILMSGLGNQPESGKLVFTLTGRVDAQATGLSLFTPGEGATIELTNDVIGRLDALKIQFGNTDDREAAVDGDLNISTMGRLRGEAPLYAGEQSYGINISVQTDPLYGIAPGRKATINVGATSIVEGHNAAIYSEGLRNWERPVVYSDYPVILNNDGILRNNNQQSNSAVVIGYNVPFQITNGNTLIGTVSLGSYRDVITNNGTWNSSDGNNDFGGGEDLFVNNGKLIAAQDSSSSELTTLKQLKSFNNAGELTLQDGAAGDILELDGNYVAAGGRLFVDSFLTGNNALSYSDRLVISGDSTGSTDFVEVRNVSSSFATGIESVQVVSIAGQSQAQFALASRVVSGAYEYLLNRHDDDGSWYLESRLKEIDPPTIRPETGAYAALLNTLFQHGWRDRFGATRGFDPQARSWLRFGYDKAKSQQEDGQIDTLSKARYFHAGVDVARWATGNTGEAVAGLMIGYGMQNNSAVSALTDIGASSSLKGWTLGAYTTWAQNGFENQGLYLDGWLAFGKYDATVAAKDVATQDFGLSTKSASVELGYKLMAHQSQGRTIWLEPQAQLSWHDFDDVTLSEASGTRISLGGQSLVGRLGLRGAISSETSTSFAQIDWIKNVKQAKLDFDTRAVDFGKDSLLRLQLGYEKAWSDKARGRVGLSKTFGSGQKESGTLTAGVNIAF